MKPDRQNTTVLLIDIRYKDSMNAFEEFYRDSVSYYDLEQNSYVEFKDFIFDSISKNIKFRKYGRIGNILTIKADMVENEIKKFTEMIENDEIKLSTEWVVTNITIIRDKEKNLKNQL